ncbi:MAG TPA: hypothetical protein VMY06_07840 [Sedimentisphaerales bacterium]|nr:hypothetical protein [Sedimentisphaerales bacterium]
MGIISALLSLITVSGLDSGNPSASELLDKYAAGQQGLQSFIVKGKWFREGSSEQAPTMVGLPGVSRFRYDSEFEGRFDGNRASGRTRLWGQVNPRLDVSKEEALYQSRLWDGKTFFQYDTSSMRPAGVCYIVKSEKQNRERDRTATTIQTSGNRFELGYLPFTDDRVDSVIRNGKSKTVRNAMEQVRGSPCYVIDADTKYGKYTIWVDPQHGYNIARATIKKSPGDLLMQAGSYRLGEGEVYSLSFESLRFEQREGLWIPMESESHDSRIYLGGGFEETLMCCKVSGIVLNPDHNALGSFLPDDIKDGARVSVDTAPGIKYTWQDGELIANVDKVAIDQIDKMADEIVAKEKVLDANRPTLARLTVSDLLVRYRDTQDKLKSFVARAKTTIEGNADKRTEERCEFRSDGNRVSLHRFSWDGAMTTKDKAGYKSLLWDGMSLIEYEKAPNSSKGKAGITKDKKLIEEKLAVDYRGAALLGVFSGDYVRVDSIIARAKKISIREKTEKIGDTQCFVIEAATERGDYTIWIDPDHGYNIAKAVVKRSKGDLIQRSTRIKRTMSFLLENVRFEQIDGVWAPMEADMKSAVDNREVAKVHHLRTEFILNPDAEILGSFIADDIPDGTAVTVAGDDGKYIWQDGKHVLEGWDNVGR